MEERAAIAHRFLQRKTEDYETFQGRVSMSLTREWLKPTATARKSKNYDFGHYCQLLMWLSCQLIATVCLFSSVY